MKKEIKILELFGGIGAIKKALINQNIKHEIVDYIENDKKTVESYNKLYDQNYTVKSVVDYRPNVDEAIDIVMHGSPCQDFSHAGQQKGGEKGSNTRSSLLWKTIRIIKEYKTRPQVIIWENVKGVLNKNHIGVFNAYLEELEKLGYGSTYKVLNAKDFGIPQNRNRVFVISIHKDSTLTFDFDNLKQTKMKKLETFLEKNVDDYYYINSSATTKAIERKQMKMKDGLIVVPFGEEKWHFDKKGCVKMPFYTFNQENYVWNGKTLIPTLTRGGGELKNQNRNWSLP